MVRRRDFKTRQAAITTSAAFVVVLLFFVVVYLVLPDRDSTTALTNAGPRLKVFYSKENVHGGIDMEGWALDPVILDMKQDELVKECGDNVAERFSELESERPQLAVELLKYCALYQHGGVYLDGESPLLTSLPSLLANHVNQNIAVLGEQPNTIHGSLLVLGQPESSVARDMISLLVETPLQTLYSSPFVIAKKLYQLLSAQTNKFPLASGLNGMDWFLLTQTCSVDALRIFDTPISEEATRHGMRLTHICPIKSGYCCQIHNGDGIILMTKHPFLPYQLIASEQLPKPFSYPQFDAMELPFISTIQEQVFTKPDDFPPTPNFYDILHDKKCLPESKECSSCLREKKGATCVTCHKVCGCYCKALCHTEVPEKFISKKVTVHPPMYARDPNRVIPRIVHQTWYEHVDSEKYPNMSRLIRSFEKSGWEYKFYSDVDAERFLTRHFPPEVAEAFQTLNPGAFKADLFRYCVLLIYGGVYADMDVLLETNLDVAVGPDVGFLVPSDEPGKQVERRMCLWNGLVAAAPGHPYLAKVIETVVNGIRNRFTSVDTDNSFCPDPELSMLHAFDTLFTAGPCILGGTVNKVLGRHGQTQYEPGNVEYPNEPHFVESTSFVQGLDHDATLRIPGKTVILKQNKQDMGAHRFTLVEKNLVVAATDLPNYDDREKLEDGKEHYSKQHVKKGVYGLEALYRDRHKADANLEFIVNGGGNRYKYQ